MQKPYVLPLPTMQASLNKSYRFFSPSMC